MHNFSLARAVRVNSKGTINHSPCLSDQHEQPNATINRAYTKYIKINQNTESTVCLFI